MGKFTVLPEVIVCPEISGVTQYTVDAPSVNAMWLAGGVTVADAVAVLAAPPRVSTRAAPAAPDRVKSELATVAVHPPMVFVFTVA